MKGREDISREARRWIGTPYVHQASCIGAGTDCLGLIRGVWRTVLGAEPEVVPPYTSDWSEPTREEAVLAAAARWLTPKPLTSEDVGDVLVFRMVGNNVAKHLGISSSKGRSATFIHAYSGHCVAETSLSMPWVRRIAGRFEFPTGDK
jgi:NlpC/P60 family putative phage cell wall peptidase